MDLGLFLPSALMNNAALNICVLSLAVNTCFHLRGIHLQAELLGHILTVFNSLSHYWLFFKVAVIILYFTNSVAGLLFL